MHEMSFAQEICRITLERVGLKGCSQVVVVGVEVGNDSGVEADNLLFWLEILLKEDPFRQAAPVIHRVEGEVLRLGYLEVEDGGSED